MRALLIGSDFLRDENDNVKFIEMNTNISVHNNDILNDFDFTELTNFISSNEFTELHYIVNRETEMNFSETGIVFSEVLESICNNLGIQFTKHEVGAASITVPQIEDSENKLILRQAYDATALIDEVYCADKKGIVDLIQDENYSIPTYLKVDDYVLDTINIDNIQNVSPNVVVKHRFPMYQLSEYPALYNVTSEDELNGLKNSLSEDNLIQQFVNSENNLVENRYSVIRSLDILYGANLDTLHLGSYTVSSFVENNIWPDEFISGSNKLTNKSKIKWINKLSHNRVPSFHLDVDTVIIGENGNLIGIDNLEVGTIVKSTQFSNLPTGAIDFSSWNSTFEETENSIIVNTAEVIGFNKLNYEGLFIRVELEDGTTWDDAKDSNIYIELKDSNITKFKYINDLEIGDKVIIMNGDTNQLMKKEVVSTSIVFLEKEVYEVNVEPQDVFLTALDIDNNSMLSRATTMLIQHNPNYSPFFCFVSGTKILMSDGLEKNIEDIVEGDIVLSYNELENKIESKEVVGLKSPIHNDLVKYTFDNGVETICTFDHPFYTEGFELSSYKSELTNERYTLNKTVKDIKIGDKLYLPTITEMVSIVSIEELPLIDTKTYIFEVKDNNNFFANGVLTHNKEVIEKFKPGFGA